MHRDISKNSELKPRNASQYQLWNWLGNHAKSSVTPSGATQASTAEALPAIACAKRVIRMENPALYSAAPHPFLGEVAYPQYSKANCQHQGITTIPRQ